MQNSNIEKIQTYRPIDTLIPQHWQSEMLTLQEGGTLHYLHTNSDKPPMIVLHGVQVDGRMWLRTAIALQDNFNVIMPDSRGHGLSSPMPTDINENTLADDITELIAQLDIKKKLIVMGHSMGAEVALRLATKVDVQQVILVDPALKNFMASMPPIGDTLPDYMTPIINTIQGLADLAHEERMQAGFTLLPPGTALWHELDYVSFVEGQSRFDVNTYKHMIKLGYIVESLDIIAQVNCPILLLTAKQMMMRPEEVDAGVAAFTDNWQVGKHIHFDDSGHFIPYDQFERFIDVVKTAVQP